MLSVCCILNWPGFSFHFFFRNNVNRKFLSQRKQRLWSYIIKKTFPKDESKQIPKNCDNHSQAHSHAKQAEIHLTLSTK